MKNNPGILAVGNLFDYKEGCKFLKSTGLWNEMSREDRDAFLLHGQVLDTIGGNKLGIVLAKKSAEQILIDRHAKN